VAIVVHETMFDEAGLLADLQAVSRREFGTLVAAMPCGSQKPVGGQQQARTALLTLALVYRVVWRRLFGQKLDSAYEGLQAHAIQFFHGLLYLLMLAMVTSGIVAVWFRGVNMFDLFTIEPFDASNKPMRRLLVNIHEIIAYALMALASVHAMVALWHHYRLKDRVMQRMWPTLSQRNPLS